MSLFISGPTSIAIITYQNIKFFLCGDRHFSTEGSCPSDIYYDIDDFIDIVIENASIEDKYVDIYLESPFPNKRRTQKENIPRRQKYFLGNTIERYSDCLYNKIECKYKNARFHYVDIRLTRNPKTGSRTLQMY